MNSPKSVIEKHLIWCFLAGFASLGAIQGCHVPARHSQTAVPEVDRYFVKLDASYDRTCGLLNTGGIYCWGAFATVETIPGITQDVVIDPQPADLPDSIDFSLIGERGICVLTDSRDASCHIQTNLVSGGPPTSLQFSNVCRIDTSADIFCVESCDGEVHCSDGAYSALLGNTLQEWGVAGRIAIGFTEDGESTAFPDSRVLDGLSPEQLSESKEALCLQLPHGTVCWNAFREKWQTPERLEVDKAHQLRCEVDNSGFGYCSGKNNVGQLAVSPDITAFRSRDDPVKVSRKKLRSIASGFRHACTLTLDHRVFCWGLAQGGQLGDGIKRHGVSPVQVSSETTYTALYSTADSTCAKRQWQGFDCWGDVGREGRTRILWTEPKYAPWFDGAEELAGPWCARRGERWHCYAYPGKVAWTREASAFHGSYKTWCWLADGEIACEAPSNHGGYNSAAKRLLSKNTSIGRVPGFICGTTQSKVQCESPGGVSREEQLDDPRFVTPNLIEDMRGNFYLLTLSAGSGVVVAPIELPSSVHNVTSITSRNDNVCVVSGAGELWCRISTADLLPGPHHPLDTWSQVDELSGVKDVQVNRRHGCALDAEGKAWCWGSAQYGGLGIGLGPFRWQPMEVSLSG